MHHNQQPRPTIEEYIDKVISELQTAKHLFKEETLLNILEKDGAETALRRKYLDQIQRLNTRIKQQRGELGGLNYAQHILKQRNEQLAEELDKARAEGRSLAERYRDVEIEAWQHIAHKYATLQGIHPEQARREALYKYNQLKRTIK